MQRLEHENVVCLLDFFVGPTKAQLAFELMECNLKDYMKARSGRLEPQIVKKFMAHLSMGMEFVHASAIIHRNLKPQNLLIKSETLKIDDFELARSVTIPNRQMTHEVICVWYRPLEILLGSQIYSIAVDMWSCGAILGEMASGAPLFMGDSEIDQVFNIWKKLGTPTEDRWPGVTSLPDFKDKFPKWPRKPWSDIRNLSKQLGPAGLDLLDGLLEYNPAKRISARAALKFAYLLEFVGPVESSNSVEGR